jgi:hypothetical protein
VEAPREAAVARVESEGSARADLHSPQAADSTVPAGREVHEPGEHSRCAGDGRGSAVAPANVARSRVERDEPPVPGADEHRVPPHRGGRVDVGPDLPSPEQVSGRSAEGVHRAVCVADEDAAVGNRRSRVEVLAAPEARERGRVPALPACLRIDAVHAAAARRDVDDPARVCRSRDDLIVGLEAPVQAGALSPAQVVRVEAVIPGSEVDSVPDDER